MTCDYHMRHADTRKPEPSFDEMRARHAAWRALPRKPMESMMDRAPVAQATLTGDKCVTKIDGKTHRCEWLGRGFACGGQRFICEHFKWKMSANTTRRCARCLTEPVPRRTDFEKSEAAE